MSLVFFLHLLPTFPISLQPGLFVLSNTSRFDSSFYNSALSPKIEINSALAVDTASGVPNYISLGKHWFLSGCQAIFPSFRRPCIFFCRSKSSTLLWWEGWRCQCETWNGILHHGHWGDSKAASGIHHSCQAMCFHNPNFLPLFLALKNSSLYPAASFPASLARSSIFLPVIKTQSLPLSFPRLFLVSSKRSLAGIFRTSNWSTSSPNTTNGLPYFCNPHWCYPHWCYCPL